MEDLTDFLRKHTVVKGDHNFLSLNPLVNYKLSKNKFWQLYTKAALVTDQLPPLLEVPEQTYSILRFDIDIYPSNGVCLKKLYEDKFVTDVIRHIHFLITDAAGKECDIEIKNANHYLSCLFEKDGWKNKDGIHIVFPELFVNNEFQNSYFVPKLDLFCKNYDYSKKHIKEINVDKVSKKPWVLFNSCKSEGDSRYKLTAVFDKNLNNLDKSTYTTPEYYSINRQSVVVFGSKFVRPICKSSRLPSEIDKDYHTIIEWDLLNHLSPSRADHYDSWIEIGIILYNIGGGEERFLSLWKEFSKKSAKYKSRVCDQKWNTFTVRNSTLRSLFYFFKRDNGQNFDRMVNVSNANTLHNDLFPGTSKELMNACILDNYHIAKIFYSKYCNDIVWAPVKKQGDWFQFNGHRWVQVSEDILRGKINEDLSSYIDELFEQIRLDKSAEEDEKSSKYLACNQLGIRKKLHSTTFVRHTLEASKSKFINANFQHVLDANKFLLGCENGVLDLEKNVFRACSPEDFISLSTGIYYRTPSEEDKQELFQYLEEVFRDADLVENVLEIIASLLVGSNDDKNILVALGPTNAGKTQLVKLFEKTLGDYAVTFPKEIVYQRTVSSATARPELARVEGKRIAFINELSKDERMNVATMKELSGNDKFYARQLYAEGSEITPMFTMYLSCNEVPRIPQDDEALWGRLLIIEFKSSFTNEASSQREQQIKEGRFPRIPNLDEKLARLAPTLLWVLFDKYAENKRKYTKGIPKCSAIRNATRKFREENNPVYRFISEQITIDKTRDDFLKCSDLFHFYSNWYKSYFPDQKIRINKEQFKQEFIKFTQLELIKRKASEHSNRKVEGWTNIIYGEKNDDTADDDDINVADPPEMTAIHQLARCYEAGLNRRIVTLGKADTNDD